MTVGGPAGVHDVDGDYGRWFAEHSVVAALQRPDFVLFGTAEDEAGTAELVGALRVSLNPSEIDFRVLGLLRWPVHGEDGRS